MFFNGLLTLDTPVGQTAMICINQLCADIKCSWEGMTRAIDDLDGWKEIESKDTFPSTRLDDDEDDDDDDDDDFILEKKKYIALPFGEGY